MENTCRAAEIPRPIRQDIDLEAIDLTDEELLVWSQANALIGTPGS